MLKSIHKRTKNVCLVLYREILIYPITDLQARACRYNLCPQLLHFFIFAGSPVSSASCAAETREDWREGNMTSNPFYDVECDYVIQKV